MRREEVPLDALVRDVADQVHVAAREKGISLVVAPLDELTVEGDDIQMCQLLSNLLDNAIKFTQPGGKVIVNGEQRNGHVLLAISDTGIGIPPPNLPYVFERTSHATNEPAARAWVSRSRKPLSNRIAAASPSRARSMPAP